MSGDGIVADMGRSVRTATPGQRARLAAMHATCVGKDCEVPFSRCEIHHVQPWTSQVGPTDEANLAPVCPREHHLLHEGGWTLELTADRVATWRLPDGTIYWKGSAINRRDNDEAGQDNKPNGRAA